METTAEGVETQEQRDAVKAEGCTEMQGYLFGRPLPASETEQLYFPGLREKPGAPAADTGVQPPIVARAGAR